MNLAEGLTRLSLRRPVLAIAWIVLATAFFAFWIPNVQRETSLRTFLGPDHPTVMTLDRHIERFGGGYPVIIAYGCDESPCETIFDPSALEMAAEVVADLEGEAGIRAVHGPANTALLVSRGEDIDARRISDVEAGESSTELAAFASAAAADPLWQRTLVSPDARVGAIIADVASTDGGVQGEVASAMESALQPRREEGWRFHLVGELVDFVYSGPDLERASQAMVPIMVVVLLVVLVLLLRSLALSLAVVGTMGIAFVWTQGAMGLAGIKLNALTTVHVLNQVTYAVGNPILFEDRGGSQETPNPGGPSVSQVVVAASSVVAAIGSVGQLVVAVNTFNAAGVGAASLAATGTAVSAAFAPLVFAAFVAVGTSVVAIALVVTLVDSVQSKVDANLDPSFDNQEKKLEFRGDFRHPFDVVGGLGVPAFGVPCGPISAIGYGLRAPYLLFQVALLGGLAALVVGMSLSRIRSIPIP